MTPPFHIRPAVLADAGLIATHRAMMYVDMGSVDLEESERLRDAYCPYLRKQIEVGQYLGWLVEDTTAGIVAGAGVTLRELAPYPGRSRAGLAASIGNVYTVPGHRRCGLARMLLQHILQWCDDHAIDQVTLYASKFGRPLYRSLGFVPTEEMRLQR